MRPMRLLLWGLTLAFAVGGSNGSDSAPLSGEIDPPKASPTQPSSPPSGTSATLTPESLFTSIERSGTATALSTAELWQLKSIADGTFPRHMTARWFIEDEISRRQRDSARASGAAQVPLTAQIESLRAREQELRFELQRVTDSLDSLASLQQLALAHAFAVPDSGIAIVMEGESWFQPASNPDRQALVLLPRGAAVTVLDYLEEGDFLVLHGAELGRINDAYFGSSPELEALAAARRPLHEAKRREEERLRAVFDSTLVAQVTERRIRAYGRDAAGKIAEQKIWLGMTDAMARESWGEPETINRTVGSFGVHEQWVYPSAYLYFENERLTSWQDSR